MDHKWKIQLDDNWARLYRWKVGEDRDTHTHRWPFRRCGRLNNRKATNYRRPAEREDKNQAESSTHWSSSRLGWIRGIIHLAPEPYLQERGDPRHTCQFLDNQIHIVSTLVCLNRLEILAWTTARGQRTTHPWIVLVAILCSRFLLSRYSTRLSHSSTFCVLEQIFVKHFIIPSINNHLKNELWVIE